MIRMSAPNITNIKDTDVKNILIVEDDPRNAELLKIMLTMLGTVNPIICRSGAEAFFVLETLASVDLVLLDLQLPGEDGYWLIKRFRDYPLLRSTLIVAVTAQVMPDDVARTEANGFDGFLGKPLNFDRFPSQIQRLLAGERVWEPR